MMVKASEKDGRLRVERSCHALCCDAIVPEKEATKVVHEQEMLAGFDCILNNSLFAACWVDDDGYSFLNVG